MCCVCVHVREVQRQTSRPLICEVLLSCTRRKDMSLQRNEYILAVSVPAITSSLSARSASDEMRPFSCASPTIVQY